MKFEFRKYSFRFIPWSKYIIQTYRDYCGDQLLVSLFDITNIYINVLYKDIVTGSAHVTLFDIKNLYKQDAVSVTRLQFNEGLEIRTLDFKLHCI